MISFARRPASTCGGVEPVRVAAVVVAAGEPAAAGAVRLGVPEHEQQLARARPEPERRLVGHGALEDEVVGLRRVPAAVGAQPRDRRGDRRSRRPSAAGRPRTRACRPRRGTARSRSARSAASAASWPRSCARRAARSRSTASSSRSCRSRSRCRPRCRPRARRGREQRDREQGGHEQAHGGELLTDRRTAASRRPARARVRPARRRRRVPWRARAAGARAARRAGSARRSSSSRRGGRRPPGRRRSSRRSAARRRGRRLHAHAAGPAERDRRLLGRLAHLRPAGGGEPAETQALAVERRARRSRPMGSSGRRP